MKTLLWPWRSYRRNLSWRWVWQRASQLYKKVHYETATVNSLRNKEKRSDFLRTLTETIGNGKRIVSGKTKPISMFGAHDQLDGAE